ncbi:hypothetical protein SacmaDRAFT_1889 [Saccharomonospora marina XMU15]|uniref:Uncharacterized protein n=1 Tax=Saccharomonospora marina XMU15 TaxID=882083 RepID=H5X7D4_9PSEU|nr:hypothetical protein SacmaDRAFT_1889 [Saccharomonospora marina XMU15]
MWLRGKHAAAIEDNVAFGRAVEDFGASVAATHGA